jgi:aminoglycoside phosphotransferase (APT) family kinase protein
VEGLRRLSGGASRETWSFDLRRTDGTVRPLILRRDPPGALRGGMGMEAALFAAAADAGVPVPAVERAGDDFIVMERLEGETIPRKILRDAEYAEVRPMLAGQCGEILSRLHRIPVDGIPGLQRGDQLDSFRAVYDSLDQPRAAFDLAFRFLADTRPEPTGEVVVHGDFRNGNLLVGRDGVRAVLDWELAHVGDPLEDLGWLCVTAWRFGVDLPVGGFGTYDDLIAGYGAPVDRQSLRWWELLGNLKWGVMCMVQASAHLSGAVRSVELAAIGRRVAEVEWDLLQLLPGAVDPAPENAASDEPGLHGVPTAAQLVEAVKEYVDRDVAASTEGRVRFHARVASNVLAMVERELRSAPSPGGVGDEAAICREIRAGNVSVDDPEVRRQITTTVRDRLAVANPRHLKGPEPPVG